MACCGNKRASIGRNQTPTPVSSRSYSILPSRGRSQIFMEYTGDTALTVTSLSSGHTYRWTAKGDIQPIARRDIPSMNPYLNVLKTVL